MPKLLVVDDEQAICWALRRLAESLGHEVTTASTAESGLEALDQFQPDVMVMDVRLPGMSGLEAIEHFRRRLGPIPIIVITAYGDLGTAVEAIRGGAFEYLIKPFPLDHVERVLTRAFERGGESPPEDQQRSYIGGLVGNTPAMQEAFKRIALAAASDACVLISGESGTGKELAARAIHRFSPRAERPFVAVNVASLSPTLAESELFGHVRGAFTGADQARVGLLVHADGGTLFLDEVADIPMPVQVKLLRALEQGEVTPVGATQPQRTNFRVISATHQNLLHRVQQGEFRHDLYFRLCAFQIEMPPLRERRDDVRELAQHFLERSKQRSTQGRPTISDATAQALERRPWYGNVRELRNAVEHALILARGGAILPEHLPAPVEPSVVNSAAENADPESLLVELVRRWAESHYRESEDVTDLYEQLLRVIEPPLFEVAMQNNRDQYAAAARTLGLHRTTLKKKLDQYGISGQ
ncbi:MAG: sigma-54 dependent transcriptional regulator [Pirellulaceae bacterium]